MIDTHRTNRGGIELRRTQDRTAGARRPTLVAPGARPIWSRNDVEYSGDPRALLREVEPLIDRDDATRALTVQTSALELTPCDDLRDIRGIVR